MKKSLIIFLKMPRPGEVKTRLAYTLGEKFAANFYRICTEHTIAESLKLKDDINVYVFYSDKKDEKEIKNWLGNNFIFYPQNGNDLGEKMSNAFNKVFSEGTEQAVIIGTDLPDINSNLIIEAFDFLNLVDLVLGPAKDGGYYLLGLTKSRSELFKDIEWSTDSVFKTTFDRVLSSSISFHTMQILNDIDIESELRAWYRNAFSKNPIKIFLDKNLK